MFISPQRISERGDNKCLQPAGNLKFILPVPFRFTEEAQLPERRILLRAPENPEDKDIVENGENSYFQKTCLHSSPLRVHTVFGDVSHAFCPLPAPEQMAARLQGLGKTRDKINNTRY